MRLAQVLAATVILLVIGSVAVACPTCKTGIEDSAAGGDLISGYFWSIVFMMATPFAILGVFSGCMYREVRKARRERQANEHGDSRDIEV